MKKSYFILSAFIIIISSCIQPKNDTYKVRSVVDSVGFAKYDWQMDSIIDRLVYEETNKTWRVAISPHDDYAYVGDLYPKVLNGIKAKTVILFGVAHKARNFNLENKIILESYDAWKAPYGNVKVSDLRNDLIELLPDSLYTIHDEMHSIEHSLEALIPFLQYNKSDLEIVPILVPYMPVGKMQQIAESLASGLSNIMEERNLNWGKDIAILISTDAVHYGDEDWGDKNYAPYGTDSLGLKQARDHEIEIINNCLLGEISPEKIERFTSYTVQESDYKEYKWTWCGRYSVPLGLLTSYYLHQMLSEELLIGTFVGYSNSIDHTVLEVEDLKMGITAPANNHHWVGYAAVVYE